ncbi:hypothetical protein G7L40_20465 [Paenibacillus polymyxa]|uniref:Uncharacterized protein n=1 Tax=Paenibacillus polymyxa TaxID=1406 RepID=A0A378Y106_PAEPO|nr:hypothetical protein [Paenibacillus polymyxa]MBE7896136.1 hypothetical protein [Paenibacillus polymyxa]MBG9765918.1 hypothetical protein [Paenibacillus polymyxa]MCC3256666.1 hypothetical protein [Paenibacillus polymyxa]QPK54843.1 hypothetical protein G7035_20510 [Paenibacillus polymyxa]QPK59933.1 hypothetical protein G7L40_20465 [Paenibacillus polymyxa]
MKTKISKEIRDSIRKAAKYRHKASHFEIIIEKWLDTNGVGDNDSFRDTYIDSVQLSNNPEEAIERFEELLIEKEISEKIDREYNN